MTSQAPQPGRGRQQLLLLATLFFAPLLLAVLFYFVFPDWQPERRTNHGQLVQPARPVPDLRFADVDGRPRDRSVLEGRWSYVYLGGESCDVPCEQKLHQIRQVRTLLNEKRQRVQRLYVAPNAEALAAAQRQLREQHPDLIFLARDGGADPARFFEARDPQALYLVDPLGNWLMAYPANAESPGLLKDIKKLLRASQIG